MSKSLRIFSTKEEYKTFYDNMPYYTPFTSLISSTGETHIDYKTPPPPQPLTFEVLTVNNTSDPCTIQVVLNVRFPSSDFKYIEYSSDGGNTWYRNMSETSSDVILTINVEQGSIIQFRGEYEGVLEYHFTDSGNMQYKIYGDALSLQYGSDFPQHDTLRGDFTGLFSNNYGLVDAAELILRPTTLITDAYFRMFDMCASLITAPELPATVLADKCYASMFSMSGLETPPSILPATTLAADCYNEMFYGCTSLASAPELPATTLAEGCYDSMFYDCGSLTTAPVLPATTLVANCYNEMFQNCSSLNYIKAMFTTTPSEDFTKQWVAGVASDGTFVKSSASSWYSYGVNAIPEGWSVQSSNA